jgi:hypothetical protein
MLGKHLPSGISDKWGYGFSYVLIGGFGKKVFASQIRIMAKIRSLLTPRSPVSRLQGNKILPVPVFHVIHSGNTSCCFPQQILLGDLLPQIFPEFSL